MAPRSKGNGAKDTETPAAPGPEQRRFDTFKGDDDEALAAELKDAHETASMLKNAQRTDGSIELQAFPPAVRSILEAFDVDGDGSVAPVELARAGELYQAEKQRSGRLKQLAIALAVLMAFVLAAVTGLTFSVVELSKETHTREDGVTLVAGTGGSSTGTVAKMAPVKQPHVLSSWLPDEAFAALETFKATSPGGSRLEMDVLGWYRVNETDSDYDMYVSIVTYSGVIRLKGEVMTFEPIVGDAFAEAGFEVDASGRRLAAVYDLVGLFNSIEEWVMLDPREDNRPPSYGTTDFVMEFDVEYKCSDEMCIDIEDYEHGAMNADGTALVISHRAEYDLHIGAVLESFTNPEFLGDLGAPSVRYDFRRPGVEFVHQLTDGDAFYCKSSVDEEVIRQAAAVGQEGIPGVFNVSSAVQISRTEDAGGRVLREFEITVEVDSVEYAMLTNDVNRVEVDLDADQTPLSHSIVYVDDADTGYPVEIRLTENITIKVTSYIEYPVDLSDYTMPTCIECDPQAPECPSKLSLMPDLFDFKRHRQQAGTVDGELVDTYMLHGSEATPKPYYAKDYFDDDELVNSNPYNTGGATRRNLRSARGRKLRFVKKLFGKKKRKKEKQKKEKMERERQQMRDSLMAQEVAYYSLDGSEWPSPPPQSPKKQKKKQRTHTQNTAQTQSSGDEGYWFDASVFTPPPPSPPPPPPPPPPSLPPFEVHCQDGEDCYLDSEDLDTENFSWDGTTQDDERKTWPSMDVPLGPAFPRPPPRCQSWSTTSRVGIYGPTQCPLDKPEITREYLASLRETDYTKLLDLLETFEPPFEDNDLFSRSVKDDADIQTVFAALERYRGRCWGRSGERKIRKEQRLKLAKLELNMYQNPVCGLHSVYIQGDGGCPFGGTPFVNFNYKAPTLCGVTTCNTKMGGSLGCRWNVTDIVAGRAPILMRYLEKVNFGAEVELKLTWEYPAALGISLSGSVVVGLRKMLPWPLPKLSIGVGVELAFEATGTIDFAKQYGQFKAGISGHVCLGICIPVSASIASPKFRF